MKKDTRESLIEFLAIEAMENIELELSQVIEGMVYDGKDFPGIEHGGYAMYVFRQKGVHLNYVPEDMHRSYNILSQPWDEVSDERIISYVTKIFGKCPLLAEIEMRYMDRSTRSYKRCKEDYVFMGMRRWDYWYFMICLRHRQHHYAYGIAYPNQYTTISSVCSSMQHNWEIAGEDYYNDPCKVCPTPCQLEKAKDNLDLFALTADPRHLVEHELNQATINWARVQAAGQAEIVRHREERSWVENPFFRIFPDLVEIEQAELWVFEKTDFEKRFIDEVAKPKKVPVTYVKNSTGWCLLHKGSEIGHAIADGNTRNGLRKFVTHTGWVERKSPYRIYEWNPGQIW